MNVPRLLLTTLGFGFLVVGFVAVLSGGGTSEQVQSLGHTLIIAGAIIVAAITISLAILERERKDYG